jgi:hypothetical protein
MGTTKASSSSPRLVVPPPRGSSGIMIRRLSVVVPLVALTLLGQGNPTRAAEDRNLRDLQIDAENATDNSSSSSSEVFVEPYHRVGGHKITESSNMENPIKLGLINGGSDFFAPVLEGFRDTCELLDLTCFAAQHSSTNTTEGVNQHVFKEYTALQWLREENIDGIAMKPATEEYNGYFPNLTANGLPVVFFDSDAPDVEEYRISYVGTDQEFMGRVMARLLRQQRPEGGTFYILLGKDGRNEGFYYEITRDNDRDDRPHWHPIPGTEEFGHSMQFVEFEGTERYERRIEWAAKHNVTAIISFRQSSMKIPTWKYYVDKYRDQNITW